MPNGTTDKKENPGNLRRKILTWANQIAMEGATIARWLMPLVALITISVLVLTILSKLGLLYTGLNTISWDGLAFSMVGIVVGILSFMVMLQISSEQSGQITGFAILNQELAARKLAKTNVEKILCLSKEQAMKHYQCVIPAEWRARPLPDIAIGDYYAWHVIEKLTEGESIELWPINRFKERYVAESKFWTPRDGDNKIYLCSPHANHALAEFLPPLCIEEDGMLKGTLPRGVPPLWFADKNGEKVIVELPESLWNGSNATEDGIQEMYSEEGSTTGGLLIPKSRDDSSVITAPETERDSNTIANTEDAGGGKPRQAILNVVTTSTDLSRNPVSGGDRGDARIYLTPIPSGAETYYTRAKNLTIHQRPKFEVGLKPDCGLLMRKTLNETTTIIVMAGIHQYGTWIVGEFFKDICEGRAKEHEAVFFSKNDFVALIKGHFHDGRYAAIKPGVCDNYLWYRNKDKWERVS